MLGEVFFYYTPGSYDGTQSSSNLSESPNSTPTEGEGRAANVRCPFSRTGLTSVRGRSHHIETWKGHAIRAFFLKFSRISVLKRSQPVSLTSLPSLVARHSKIRRPKRGWCAFCSSSKKRAILTVEYVHGQGQRKPNVFFGCEQCNVLCKDGDCWSQWHKSYNEVEN